MRWYCELVRRVGHEVKGGWIVKNWLSFSTDLRRSAEHCLREGVISISDSTSINWNCKHRRKSREATAVFFAAGDPPAAEGSTQPPTVRHPHFRHTRRIYARINWSTLPEMSDGGCGRAWGRSQEANRRCAGFVRCGGHSLRVYAHAR